MKKKFNAKDKKKGYVCSECGEDITNEDFYHAGVSSCCNAGIQKEEK